MHETSRCDVVALAVREDGRRGALQDRRLAVLDGEALGDAFEFVRGVRPREVEEGRNGPRGVARRRRGAEQVAPHVRRLVEHRQRGEGPLRRKHGPEDVVGGGPVAGDERLAQLEGQVRGGTVQRSQTRQLSQLRRTVAARSQCVEAVERVLALPLGPTSARDELRALERSGHLLGRGVERRSTEVGAGSFEGRVRAIEEVLAPAHQRVEGIEPRALG